MTAKTNSTSTTPPRPPARSRRVKRSPSRLLTVAPFALVVVGAAFAGAWARGPHRQTGQTPASSRLPSALVDGKSQAEARAALTKWAKTQAATPVALRFDPHTGVKRVWKFEARRLGLGLDVAAMLAAANKPENGGALAQVSQWLSGRSDNNITSRTTVDAHALRSALRRIGRAVNRPAKDARLVFLPGGGFGAKHDLPGRALDLEQAANAITQAWNEYQTRPQRDADAPPSDIAPVPPDPKPSGSDGATSGQAPEPSGQAPIDAVPASPTARPAPAAKPETETLTVTLPTKEVAAGIGYADLKPIDGPLGGMQTRFHGDRSRGSNIALAASRINGTLLKPGDIFSYNKVVGPRIASAGFKDAPVIIKGELVPGIGGGICQVSSTLYNAALLSDMKIVRRSHHAFHVHYLPAGRDATVVDGAIDFQFQNNTSAPVYIAASSGGGRLRFTLYGKRTPGRVVDIERTGYSVEPNTTETYPDPTLPAGRRVVKDKGHRGERVTVYRVVRDNGQVVRRELISKDHYRPFPTVVLVGTRPVKPRATKTKVKPMAAPANAATPTSSMPVEPITPPATAPNPSAPQ